MDKRIMIAIVVIIVIVIGYFVYSQSKKPPPPSVTACSPTNLKGECAQTGYVCNAVGVCVNGQNLPCSPSNLYGSCGPNDVCNSITGSPDIGTCIPNKYCGPPPQYSTTGYCASSTTCVDGICTSTEKCGNGPGLSPNGSCSDGQVCNSGTCGPVLDCGPGNEKPTPTTSESGRCYQPGEQCFSGICKIACGTGFCPLGQECLSGTCVSTPPVKECTLNYGNTPGATTCNSNFPICNLYVPGSAFGICATDPSFCNQDSDCQNSSYPYGECNNNQCEYPSQRPDNMPCNLSISLNGTTFDTPAAYNADNCNTCSPNDLQFTNCDGGWYPSMQACGAYGSDYTRDNTLKQCKPAALPSDFNQECICKTNIFGYCWAGRSGYNTNDNLPTFYTCQ